MTSNNKKFKNFQTAEEYLRFIGCDIDSLSLKTPLDRLIKLTNGKVITVEGETFDSVEDVKKKEKKFEVKNTLKDGEVEITVENNTFDSVEDVVFILSEHVSSIHLSVQLERVKVDILSKISEKCPNLRILHLSGSRVTDEGIAEITSRCKKLNDINIFTADIGDVALNEIGKSCCDLIHLRIGGIGRCPKVTDEGICSIAEGCPKLKSLDLLNCRGLTDEALEIVANRMPEITGFSSWGCNFTTLPYDIGNLLPNLQYLAMPGNKIQKLPLSIVNFRSDIKLDFNGNPLKEPPLSVVKDGMDAIKRYFEALDDRAGKSNQLKVVIIGQGHAGKTALLNAISGKSSPLKTDETVHVDIRVVPLAFSANNKQEQHNNNDSDPFQAMINKILGEEDSDGDNKNDQNETKLAFYDFGGQKEYEAAQAPYVTESALFLFVVPADEANNENFPDSYEKNFPDSILRFLTRLQLRVPGATVQLVITKTDLLKPENEIDDLCEWLQKRIQITLKEWKNASSEHGHSNERGSKYFLNILPEVLHLSVKTDSAKAKQQFDGRVQSIIEEGLCPTIGQAIPYAWLMVWYMLGAVQRLGIDADDQNIFQSMLSPNAERPSNDLGGKKAKAIYCSKKSMNALWDRFIDKNSDIKSHNKTFDDAVRLLQAEGVIFMDVDLIFLDPTFVADLLSPLVDRNLTMKSSNLELRRFCIHNKPGSYKCSEQSLERLVKSGELHFDILPFLWRDLDLREEDFMSAIEIFINSGIIFLLKDEEDNELRQEDNELRQFLRREMGLHDEDLISAIKVLFTSAINFSQNGNDHHHPVVLYRLPLAPPDHIEEKWPVVPEYEKQLELRIKCLIDCPPDLAARFAAASHVHGTCYDAWMKGAIVMNDKAKIKVDVIKDDKNLTVLRFAVRGEEFSSDIWDFIEKAADFFCSDAGKVYQGLLYEMSITCPQCILKGKDTKVGGIQFESKAELKKKKSFVCEWCGPVQISDWFQGRATRRRCLSHAHSTQQLIQAAMDELREEFRIEQDEAMKKNKEDLVNALKEIYELLPKKLPLPAKFSMHSVAVGLKKELVMYFECYAKKCDCQFPGECADESEKFFEVRTDFMSKWPRVLYSALKIGIFIFKFNPGVLANGIVEAGRVTWHAISKLHIPDKVLGGDRIYNEGDKVRNAVAENGAEEYDSMFQKIATQDFPTSEEQDELIEMLHKDHFFEHFEYWQEEQKWVCLECHKKLVGSDMNSNTDQEETQNFFKEGRLEMRSRSFFSFGRWQSWHVEIQFDENNKQIQYSKQKNKFNANANAQKIEMKDIIYTFEMTVEKRHCFKVRTSATLYTFAAKTIDETKEWSKHLDTCIEKMKEN